MDLMAIRRGLMMSMAEGIKAETIVIPDDTLTNSSNFDAYFEQLVNGWNTEIILLFKKDLSTYISRRLIGGWSAYAQNTNKSNSAFTDLWRYESNKIMSINRNDWSINVNSGDEYYVVRFGQFTF